MARTGRTSRLAYAASAFFRVRLPPDFVIPASGIDSTESQDTDDTWARCFQALRQVRDFLYIRCGRLVEDPTSAILFIAALSPEALDALFETPQYKDCLTALGLEEPPLLLRTVDLIWPHELRPGRMTFAFLSFPYPATQEQRDGYYDTGRVPLPNLFWEEAPLGRSSRTLGPRECKVWVRGPQKLSDGREVEMGLIYQPWLKPEHEDAAAEEELETRERWMSAVSSRLGLVAMSVERYDMYRL